MRNYACLFLLLALAVCLSDCHPKRGGRAMKAMRRMKMLRRKATMRQWFGPVDDAAQCEDFQGGEFEVQTADRPSSECEEAGETVCLCMESIRSLRQRRLAAGGAGGKRKRGGRGRRGRAGRRGGGRRRGGNRPGLEEVVEEEDDDVELNEIEEEDEGADVEPQLEFKYKCGTCSFKWGPGQNSEEEEEEEDDNDTI